MQEVRDNLCILDGRTGANGIARWPGLLNVFEMEAGIGNGIEPLAQCKGEARELKPGSLCRDFGWSGTEDPLRDSELVHMVSIS